MKIAKIVLLLVALVALVELNNAQSLPNCGGIQCSGQCCSFNQCCYAGLQCTCCGGVPCSAPFSCTSRDGCCSGFCNVVTEDGTSVELASTLPELIKFTKVELEFESNDLALKTALKYLQQVEQTPHGHLTLPNIPYGTLLCDQDLCQDRVSACLATCTLGSERDCQLCFGSRLDSCSACLEAF